MLDRTLTMRKIDMKMSKQKSEALLKTAVNET